MIAYNKIFVFSNDKQYCKNIWHIVSAFGGFVFVGSADLKSRSNFKKDLKKADTIIFDLNSYTYADLLKLKALEGQKIVGVGGNEENFKHYLSHGVDVYIKHKIAYAELLDTIKSIGNNRVSFDIKQLSNITKTKKPYRSELTERELEVLQALSLSQSYSQISNSLYISIDTVKTHLKNIYSKLDTSSRFKAVEKARLENII